MFIFCSYDDMYYLLIGFLNAAPKRLKQLNWNLVTFPKYVLV